MAQDSSQPFRIVVVGGGITGLAAAYRLSQRLPLIGRTFDLQLFEASETTGGYLRTTSHDGFLLETGADGFLTDKPRGVELCRELGIARELIETQKEFRRSFIVHRGRLVPIPQGFYLLAPSQ